MKAHLASTENNAIRIRDLVDGIVAILDCSQKTLCSLVGITPTALSISIEKPYQEVHDNKVAKRLMSLLYVLETLKKDKSLDAPLILKVLTTPCYRLEDGTFLDVVAAIHEGSVRNEFLITVADAALEMLRSRYKAEKWPVENGLYKKAIGEIGDSRQIKNSKIEF